MKKDTIVSVIAVILAGLVTASCIQEEQSPAPQPYRYLNGGKMVGSNPDSPDPMFGYRWDNPQPSDTLQIYIKHPMNIEAVEGEGNFDIGNSVRVTGNGVLRFDFGVELPAWLEIDSPDLGDGDISLGVSEYNVTEHMGKIGKPVRYGNTYRYEPNKELYEGLRFGFLEVKNFTEEFTITAIRAVCQVKPANYTGSFKSDNSLLNRIWYTGAYDVRANQRMDCFGAILLDRGDRISWTGDAYPAQAASLVAFSNYEEVLKNLHWTEGHPNGIETYELYWVESLIDYYMYSGDEKGFRELLPNAFSRLDHAYDIFDNPTNLRFVGWDQRIGTGFDRPNCPEGKRVYRMCAIGAWKHMAKVLRMIGEDTTACKFEKMAEEKTAIALPHIGELGMHASADAINADLCSDLQSLYHKDFSDREQRLSYSPFNQYFILSAMAHAGHYDDAMASIFDMWGGQILYGGTCFFEVFRPDWIDCVGKNGPIPFTQAGFTSLAHPWGAGVTAWMTEEILGIKPLTGGFATFAVMPHLSGSCKNVSGEVMTPHGSISASFDISCGRHTVIVPEGTVCEKLGIPKEGMSITSMKVNGSAVKNGPEDDCFIYLENLHPGTYKVDVTYEGIPTAMKEEQYQYAVPEIVIDSVTHGEWFKNYGRDGHYILCGQENGEDISVLPPYVESLTFDTGENDNPKLQRSTSIKPLDERAVIPVSSDPCARKVFGGCYPPLSCSRMPLEVRLKEENRPYRLAVYMADCDKGDRDYIVEIFDLETMNRISPCVRIKDLKGGVYAVFEYDRSVRVMLSHVRGDNAVFNAVFFDTPKM